MKKKFFTPLLAIASVGLYSCGGGGSGSGSDGGGGAVLLDTASGEIMARNVSSSLPGCTYISDSTAAEPPNTAALKLYQATIHELLDDRTAQRLALHARADSAFQARARDINESSMGNCPDLAGSFTIIGSHDNGTDDVIYTYDNYCTTSTDGRTVLNGIMAVREVGTPSSFGPIPQFATLSTGSSGLQITEESSEGSFNHSINISGLRFTYGNGDENATQSSPDRFELGSMRISEGRENKVFEASNVDVSSYASDGNDVVIINSFTHNDPDLGTVSLSTTPLVIDENGVLLSGAITATGADNSTMVLTRSQSVNNAFDVMLSDSTAGVLNCSGFNVLGQE